MTKDDFLAGLTEALELENEAQLGDEFRDYDEWDSLTFLALITHMRNEYGVVLDIDTFNSILTWQDLYNYATKDM